MHCIITKRNKDKLPRQTLKKKRHSDISELADMIAQLVAGKLQHLTPKTIQTPNPIGYNPNSSPTGYVPKQGEVVRRKVIAVDRVAVKSDNQMESKLRAEEIKEEAPDLNALAALLGSQEKEEEK